MIYGGFSFLFQIFRTKLRKLCCDWDTAAAGAELGGHVEHILSNARADGVGAVTQECCKVVGEELSCNMQFDSNLTVTNNGTEVQSLQRGTLTLLGLCVGIDVEGGGRQCKGNDLTLARL